MIIEKILKTIWKEFIFGGHFQSLGAASIVFASSLLLNLKISWDILFISYLLFYPLYLFNRFKEIKIDYLTNPQRTEYLKTYIHWTPLILPLVIFILILNLIYFTNFWAIIFGLFLLLFGLLYTLIFKKLTQKIPLFKDFYVATFFALLVIFPIIYYSFSLTKALMVNALILTFFVFLKALMMQILLDLKDLDSDQREGLLTLPTIFGKERTLRTLKGFSILATIPIPIAFSLYFPFFSKSMLMLFLTIPFDFYCFKLAREEKYSGYILMSGIFLFWPILILAAKILIW